MLRVMAGWLELPSLVLRLAACGLLAGSVAPACAELTAERLDGHNLQRRVAGSDAIAGRGDWLLSNGHLCAAISGAEHETGLSASGGWLVDLGHCGGHDDQFTYHHLLPDMDRAAMLPVIDISPRVDEHAASLVVTRSDGRLEAVIRYSVRDDVPDRVRVASTWRRLAAGDSLGMVGQLWLHPHRSMVPFSINTRDPSLSVGYTHPSFDVDDRSSTLNAMLVVDLTVLVGSALDGPGISYGLRSGPATLTAADGTQRALPQYALVEADFSNQLWLSRPLWLGGSGKPGRLEMLQSLFMDLRPGDTLDIEQDILVGHAADVASITNDIFDGQWLQGRIDTGQARIAAFDASGNPLTEARPDAQGNFRLRLPRGLPRCELEIRTPWQAPRRVAIELDGTDRQLAPMDTAAPGEVILPRGEPMRLVFVGRDGTPDPALPPEALAGDADPGSRHGDGRSNDVSLTGRADDPLVAALPRGRYRVYATRGIEYTVSEQDIEVLAGQSVRLQPAPLRRVVDSRGWVSVDFHVHSGFSFDSALPPELRLRSFIAQGAAVLVATEHDVVADLGGLAARLGMDDQVTVVSGGEVTGMARTGKAPQTIGHLNLFPLQRDGDAFAGGMPRHESLRLRSFLAGLRPQHPEVLIQLNHPRSAHEAGDDMAFFDHLSVGERFEPRLPLRNAQNRSLLAPDPATGVRDLDFDTLELANGALLEEYQQVRADWLSLSLQGEYRPAVASSDSHQLREPVAMPRSYVRYDGPLRHPIATGPLFDAVRRGEIVGSSGPLPRLELENEAGQRAGIGALLAGQRLTLRVSAQAAPWVDVKQVWVYLNGAVVKGAAIAAGEELEMPLEVDRDGFVTVEFFGEPGEVYRALAPGYTPMAFTNPVWIDADGDGQWTPPGLLPLPLAISHPTSIPDAPPHR